MSDGCDSQVGGWSPNTLREFIQVMLEEKDKRFEGRFADFKESVSSRFAVQSEGVATAMQAADRAVSAALAAADRAVGKAEAAAEKRFEGVNEFRSTLADQQRTLLPRIEADLNFKALTSRLDTVESAVRRAEGVGVGVAKGWALAVGLMGLISVVIAALAMFGK